MTFSEDRYAGGDAAFDPQHGVRRNKLGIIDPDQLEIVTGEYLDRAYLESFQQFSDMHRFTEQDVCSLHRVFLADVFEWAGEYRNVDLVSEDIHWCRAIFVPQEMQQFGVLLAEYTPFSTGLSNDEVAERLAKLHGELILIHPFRDGNGRLTRLLCDLLLVQAGREPTHRTAIANEKYRPIYLKAIRTFHFTGDLQPLMTLFEDFL